jgi:hypothetical protein
VQFARTRTRFRCPVCSLVMWIVPASSAAAITTVTAANVSKHLPNSCTRAPPTETYVLCCSATNFDWVPANYVLHICRAAQVSQHGMLAVHTGDACQQYNQHSQTSKRRNLMLQLVQARQFPYRAHFVAVSHAQAQIQTHTHRAGP